MKIKALFQVDSVGQHAGFKEEWLIPHLSSTRTKRGEYKIIKMFSILALMYCTESSVEKNCWPLQ